MKMWEIVGEGKKPKKNNKVRIIPESEVNELLAKNDFKNKILKEILKGEIKEAKLKLKELKNG
jgi:hypothetical protein